MLIDPVGVFFVDGTAKQCENFVTYIMAMLIINFIEKIYINKKRNDSAPSSHF